MSAPRRSAAAFRAALKDRLKAAASSLHRPYNELEREFVPETCSPSSWAAW
jgi:hypothetical protein